MQELIKIYLYPRSSILFHFGPSTKSCERISLQFKTYYMHRPFHPPVRSTVQNLKLLVTKFSSITFSLLHPYTYVGNSKSFGTFLSVGYC